MDTPASFDLADLVVRLRESGFRADTRQYLTAHQLLLSLSAHGKRLDHAGNPDSVVSHLRPVFCTSLEEQVRFDAIARSWLRAPAAPPAAGRSKRSYTDPHKWIAAGTRLGRLAVGLALVLLAAYLAHHWLIPIEIHGTVLREEAWPDGGRIRSEPAPLARVAFGEQAVALDGLGRFVLRTERIRLPKTLTASLPDHRNDVQVIRPAGPYEVRMILRPNPTSPPQRSQAVITIGQPQTLSLPSARTPLPEIRRWPWMVGLSAAAALAAYLFLLASERLRRHLVLKRLPVDQRPELHTLISEATTPAELSGPQLRRLVGGLRRPREQEAVELEVEKTVAATARAAGWFSPVFVPRRQMPEYVVLVSRRSAEDHQARWIDVMLQRIEQNGVVMTRYHFSDDPRVCRRADNPGMCYQLSELAVIHHAATLFLFTESAACFDPVSGRPTPWTETLRSWPRRVLFTPETPYRWTQREWALAAEGMIIYPATAAGLQSYAGLSGEWRIERLFPAPYARSFPAIIGADALRWQDKNPPPAETQETLLRQLKGYLGPEGFLWLCACAVYPEISWPLTWYLAETLHGDDRSPKRGSPYTRLLPSLARLPWFRSGTMPDWLRLALIGQLTARQEADIRRALKLLIEKITTRPAAQPGPAVLSFAPWLEPKDILQTASTDSLMHEAVFLGFMSGASLDQLGVQAPYALERLFRHLRALPQPDPSGFSRAPRTFMQRVKARLLAGFTFHRALARASVALVLGALVMAALAPALTQSPPPGAGAEILCWAFYGDLAAAGSSDGAVRLMRAAEPPDLKDAALLSGPGGNGRTLSLRFSPDGAILAAAGEDGAIHLWDTAGGKVRTTFTGHTDSVTSVAFSPDGRALASGSADRTVKLWDTAGGTLRATLAGHTDSVTSAAFSPDGRTLASGSTDKTVRLWDTAGGMARATLAGHADSVTSVAFSPDGRTLASGSTDKTVRLWDVQANRELKILEGHTAAVLSLAFSADGRILASASGDGTGKLWDIAPGQELETLRGSSERVLSVAFYRDSNSPVLVLAAADGLTTWPVQIKPPEPAGVQTPDLVGRSLRDAETLLIDRGLKPGRISSQENIRLASNTVMAQQPAPGTVVPEGTAVDLVVARPPVSQQPASGYCCTPNGTVSRSTQDACRKQGGSFAETFLEAQAMCESAKKGMEQNIPPTKPQIQMKK
jgi:hypothetical protein